MMRTRNATVSIGITVALVWSLWLTLMVQGDRFGLFAENWFMSVIVRAALPGSRCVMSEATMLPDIMGKSLANTRIWEAS